MSRFIPARAGNTSPSGPTAPEDPVHPRSRGEHLHDAAPPNDENGSSPLARGTLAIARALPRLPRFIPARAGNTMRRIRLGCRLSVHPRSRGEHATGRGCSRGSSGSSPLARGTRRQGRHGRHGRRFIPARAGNTRSPPPAWGGTTVHPRSRGEHSGSGGARKSSAGSSPLARGTPPRRRHDGGDARFIPARAGNTSSGAAARRSGTVHPRSRGEHLGLDLRSLEQGGSSPLARGTRDGSPPRAPARPVHPRSRGEHAWGCRCRWPGCGSSPLARGTHPRPRRVRTGLRFIPARAGNTWRTNCASWWRAVHPRSRGEHGGLAREPLARSGSSPLARGTPRGSSGAGEGGRFIPARAGNTCQASLECRQAPVHPRSRGEHRVVARRVGRRVGSSPLARGTPRRGRDTLRLRRFIPARAGNT